MGGDGRQLLHSILKILSDPDLDYPHRIKALLKVLASRLPINNSTLYLNSPAKGLPSRVMRADSPGFFEPDSGGSPRSAGWHPLDADGVLSFPLTGGGREIGLLSLHGVSRPEGIAPWREDLEQICGQIAFLTLQHGQKLRQQQQLERLEFLARISQRLNQAQTVREMLTELLSSLVRQGKAIFTVAHHGRADDRRNPPIFELAAGYRSLRQTLLAISDALHREVIACGQPVLRESLHHSELNDLPLPFTALGIPLVFGERILGTLVLMCAKEESADPFVSRDKSRRLFYDLAVQAAEAWGRISGLHRLAAVSKENDRKLREISFLYHASRAMHGPHGLDDLVHFILSVTVLPQGAGCDRAMLFMVNERSRYIQGMLGITRETSLKNWSPQELAASPAEPLVPPEVQQSQRSSVFSRMVQQQRLPLDAPDSFVSRAARERRVILVPAEKAHSPMARELELGTYVCVPLLGRKETLAVLVSDNCRSGRLFDQDELRFLELFANQAGAAIENAMLVQQLQSTHNDLRSAQENLLQTEKLATIGEIAASVAHELKNPLVCVGGFAQRLLKNVPEGSRPYEYAEIIAREVRRVEEMLTNILSFSKRQMLCFAECNIIEVIGSALNLVSRELTEAGIDIEQNLAPDLPMIVGDERQLRQVLINLLGNAREVMGEGGTITVRAYPSTLRGDPAVTVEVEDTGGGIPPESLRNIFNPFFTTKATGTGLGLSISHRIIEHHRGVIEVFNGPEGATFIIQLPRGRKRYYDS